MVGGTLALASIGASAATVKKTARPAGTAYAATTADGGVHVVLSRDQRQVRSGLIAYKSRCSDGDTVYDYDTFAAIPVAANRTFKYSYHSGPTPSTVTPGATFAYTESFNGTVNKAATKIVGTYRETFAVTDPAGVTTTCDSGTIAYKAVD